MKYGVSHMKSDRSTNYGLRGLGEEWSMAAGDYLTGLSSNQFRGDQSVGCGRGKAQSSTPHSFCN